MKIVKRLAIIGIILCVLGFGLVAATYFINKDKIAEMNEKFSSAVYEIKEVVTDLDVEATDGAIYIVRHGDKTIVSVDDCYTDRLSVEVVNGVLTVKENFPETVNAFGWELPAFLIGVNSAHNNSITITLPEDISLNKSYVCMGKGDIVVTSMKVKEPVFHLGIGSLQISSITGCSNVKSQVILGQRHFEWLDGK